MPKASRKNAKKAAATTVVAFAAGHQVVKRLLQAPHDAVAGVGMSPPQDKACTFSALWKASTALPLRARLPM